MDLVVTENSVDLLVTDESVDIVVTDESVKLVSILELLSRDNQKLVLSTRDFVIEEYCKVLLFSPLFG